MPKIKKTRNSYVPHVQLENAPQCQVPGCRDPGEYKAPKSKSNIHDYQWYCLEHIREYNRQWDFFKDMDRQEIESFMKDAITGHRPTWNREGHTRAPQHALYDALYEFLNTGHKRPKSTAPNAKLRKALATLDMDYPYTARELKTQYRALVKKYHPDVNKSNKQAEEKFKQIAAAYLSLSQHLKAP